MKRQTPRDELRHAHSYVDISSTRSVILNDGKRYEVPTEEGREKELATRQRVLAGWYLEETDRRYPSYAIKLPSDMRVPHHADWEKARRAYVLGDDSALERMTLFVTMMNPPWAADVKPPPPPAQHGPDWRLVVVVVLMMLILGAIVAAAVQS